MDLREHLRQWLVRGAARRLNNLKIARAARKIPSLGHSSSELPVAFFKASTGIDDLSWNSGFHLLASWAVRLRGVPVAYFACHAGMSRCILGTHREKVGKPPPCRSCIYQSRMLYEGVRSHSRGNEGVSGASEVHWFGFARDPELEAALQGLGLNDLARFVWPLPPTSAGQATNESRAPDSPAPTALSTLPLGALCLPGLRWILRRHELEDDEGTRFLLREYILSAWNVALQFTRFLDAVRPRVLVTFNGQFFPEAVGRAIAMQRKIRVITHEVGLQPASAFFTEGEATAYPMQIPEDFELSPEQNARLDAYLELRFQGKFSMAGIQFWPSMRGLDDRFLGKAKRFRQIVPVFTNVIFDTSQPHANTVFSDMFEWLDTVSSEIKPHPETLFVIRAHPDETRLRKESRETVEAWARRSGMIHLPNVAFIPPKEYLSSYELIQRAKFVMVYNSTIGLEASIMGVPVLCGGKARFTQYPTVFFPRSRAEHQSKMRELLAASRIDVPEDFRRNARRFLYYQLFRASLPFGDFLEPSIRTTQTKLKAFDAQDLLGSEAVKTILSGLLEGGDFLLTDWDPRT